jgi:DMSO/TMAO reductase YedYZ molybdopterin-dependent catalytic subunit
VNRRIYLAFLAFAVLIAVGLGLYLHFALSGPATVRVEGQVATPYDYPRQHGDIPQVTAEGTLNGVTTRYTGTPVREIVERAGPAADATLLLARGADGYTFFISMAEVRQSPSLLLAAKGSGSSAAYDVVGAANSKAWVRDVASLTIVGGATLEINGALGQAGPFDPTDWQFQMDSTRLDVGDGPQKYQGVPLGVVLEAMAPQTGASTVAVYAAGTTEPAVTLPLDEVLADEDLRLFTIMSAADVSFSLARMGGEVLVPELEWVEVQ